MELVSSPESPSLLSISNKPNKSLSIKLSQVLSSSSSKDAEIKAALISLSNISLDEANLRTDLRGELEKEQIRNNKKFLNAFENVVKVLFLKSDQFDFLETQVKVMNNECQDLKQKLSKVQVQTSDMIEQANKLQDHNISCSIQKTVIDRFLEKFTLSQEEIKTLSDPSEPIDNVFFTSLSHLHQIHNDCQLLLSTKDQTAGRDIMESMALYQENAYNKLYKWMQYESRTVFGGESIDISSLMTKALRALMLRPVLFQTILDEIGSARHDAVSQAFLKALTRGGPGGTPRPIELQAPDPLRYIGDMLAWVHQACASEKEMLETLLGENSEAINELLDCAMDGTCRPLRTRMEQVLTLQPGAITSYKVANLIQFYAITLSKLMRKNTSLERVLYEMTELAYKYFFKTLNAQAERLMQSAEPPNHNLSIVSTVREMTNQLKEILASYDSSLVAIGIEGFNFAETLDAIIEPLLNTCELSVSKKFKKMDQDIYMMNCLYRIQNVLIPYEFTKQKRASIEARMNDILDDIAHEEYNELLQQSGLTQIKEMLATKDPNTPLSSLMDVQILTNIMAKFDTFLVSISADVSPQLQRLSSSQHCQQVQSNVIRLLLETYREISKEVNNGYEHPELILPRTVQDMEAIFSFVL
ncbi:oligomeric Golgi complex subunit 6-like protein [Cokeromyces recurvatus]|uniref:oligomeric Golgi complex subunit 6-like protein n=1 Tax=Cokeromyces recurvatus TaxID=90255 RepID=UPI0022209133|nr:oligomeric Golgi complex subunit 6-like protein [Cokeromyces recurvatus]KAI7907855.1 oligomeric Golgi complex subunit 6-like protein [Cokeromyces recurvatus]